MRALQFHFRIVFSNSFCLLFSHNCWLTEKNPTESRTDYSCLHIAGAWRDSQQQTWLFVLEILADFLDGNSEAPLSPHSPQGTVWKLWVGQRLAARRTRVRDKDPGREMGKGGNKPESKGEDSQQETAHQVELLIYGFLGQWFFTFHFKLLLAFHYAIISFCYPYKSLLYTPASIGGALWRGK